MTQKSVATDFSSHADVNKKVMDKKEFIRKLLFDQTNHQKASALTEVFSTQQLDIIKAKVEVQLEKSEPKEILAFRLEQLFNDQITNDSLSKQAINLISFIDPLVDSLLSSSALAKEIKEQLNRLRIPLLLLVAKNPKLLLNQNNTIKLLVNDLLSVGLLWQADERGKQLLQQITQTASHLLSATFEESDFEAYFKNITKQFSQFANTIVKRAEIFERRVKEAENGQAKAQAAKLLTEKAINEILNKKGTPDFVSVMLSKAWQHVIFLESLKVAKKNKTTACFSPRLFYVVCNQSILLKKQKSFLNCKTC